jgi:Pre-rRNA-processing protein TSR2
MAFISQLEILLCYLMEEEAQAKVAQAKFTHATALIIHSWSALDIAVKNEWAGPESSDIRDWLGGVIVDMFSFPPGKKVEVEDVEEVLSQVVEDEFELRLEDDSAYQVCAVQRGCVDVRWHPI